MWRVEISTQDAFSANTKALPYQQLTNQPFNFGGWILELLYWTFVNIVTYFVSCSFFFSFFKHLSLGGILCRELPENSVPSLGRADDRTSLVN